MSYFILWKYRVKEEFRNDFIAAYERNGDWSRLFRLSSGYVGTELFADTCDGHSMLTLDEWKSKKDFIRFMNDHELEYHRLDALFEKYTEKEERIMESAV